MPDIEIKPLSASANIRAMLCEMLIETVANGGSVSFMHPLAPEAADAFWRDWLASWKSATAPQAGLSPLAISR